MAKLSKKLKRKIKKIGGKKCLKYLDYFKSKKIFKKLKHIQRIENVLYSLNKKMSKELKIFIHSIEDEFIDDKKSIYSSKKKYNSCGK